jgi:hypothetical protein
MFTPASDKHYSVLHPTIPLKVFVNMTPAVQLKERLSERRNDEINIKAINALLIHAKLCIQNGGGYFE